MEIKGGEINPVASLLKKTMQNLYQIKKSKKKPYK